MARMETGSCPLTATGDELAAATGIEMERVAGVAMEVCEAVERSLRQRSWIVVKLCGQDSQHRNGLNAS